MFGAGHLIGNYKIKRGPLGSEPSAFGEVYEAAPSSDPDTMLALKINVKTDTDSIQRFEQENAILHILKPHNGVILPYTEIIDDEISGLKYYCMELAESNIAEFLLGHPPMDPNEVLSIFKQICVAVEYAHSKDVVHRDMHYGNILLHTKENIPQIKLTDFGRAKNFNGQKSTYEPAIIWGRDDTRAPETFFKIWSNAAQTDYALSSDIYSLGIILSYLFGIDSTPYIFAQKCSIATYFLDTNTGMVTGNLGLHINDTTKEDKLLHYTNWTTTFDYNTEIAKIKVVTTNTDLDIKVNEIIHKCCNTQYNSRYASVSDILAAMDGLC